MVKTQELALSAGLPGLHEIPLLFRPLLISFNLLQAAVMHAMQTIVNDLHALLMNSYQIIVNQLKAELRVVESTPLGCFIRIY